MTAPRRSRRRRSAACERIFFSNQKNIPSRFPRKIVRGDGVVTSSISLAAAQRAPAHSFRCSSFSHRKTLRWEPCISPLTTPLKRPKERPAGLSFGNLSGGGRGTGDGGRGTPGSSCPTGGAESLINHPGQPAHSGAIAAAGAREGWKSARGASPKGIAATSTGGALSEAGTFASAASGGRSEQKGVAAVKIL